MPSINRLLANVGFLWHACYCWCSVARILLAFQPASQPASQPSSEPISRLGGRDVEILLTEPLRQAMGPPRSGAGVGVGMLRGIQQI